MIRVTLGLVMVLMLSACAGSGSLRSEPRERGFFSATGLLVDQTSDGRKVVEDVAPESVLERFDMIDDHGQRLAYVAFTDTDVGGLVFVNNRFVGTVSKHDARVFYSCRGYATANGRHWGAEATTWGRSLLAAVEPREAITLEFTGKSALQSIKEVSGNAMISQLRSLVDIGSNPLNIVKAVTRARDELAEREKYEAVIAGLRSVRPGQSEAAVASVARPEDLAFVRGGLIMAYQRFLIEFYLSQGTVRLIQQPSLHQLTRTYAGIFYLADAQWALCTPDHWRQAVKEIAHQEVPSYAPAYPSGEGR